ncbi:RNA polymerase subunit sigma-70 [Micromonospora sp. NPDC092111]|uniref:RNA polymerase subunit sigma-70 n=1 Tax=Micromonospora sp. NPDC092111 TaxID=3364289 RepID=UPI003819B27B
MTAPDDVALGPDFAELVHRHHRELHLHCYRLLASFDDAEDAVQETYLRAWRGRDGFDGGPLVRAWLYRIATNVCLDVLRRTARQPRAARSLAEVPWLQPYPDRLLDGVAPDEERPDAVVVTRETVELAFLAAMQLLPARQRAAFLVRDVLGWSSAETAELLGTSVAAANSALQRARATMQARLPARRADWTTGADADRELLARFIDAHERGDAAAALAVAAPDLRVTMPPAPLCFDGVDQVRPLLERAFGPDRAGDWRLLPTRANRMPAAASYLRRPGDTAFRPFKLDVLRVRDDRIAEITTFGYALFPQFGLPASL